MSDETKPEQRGEIEMSATWAGLLPYLLLGVESGNTEGRKLAKVELQRMARAADKWNEHVKAQKGQAA